MKIKQFNDSDRFLHINVYKFPLGNCGGVTDHNGGIYVPCDDGPFRFDSIKDEEHLIFIEEHRGGDYWALRPVIEPEGMLGPMSGGNLAYSSDSRCKRVYHIHDRFETQETYNALSR